MCDDYSVGPLWSCRFSYEETNQRGHRSQKECTWCPGDLRRTHEEKCRQGQCPFLKFSLFYFFNLGHIHLSLCNGSSRYAHTEEVSNLRYLFPLWDNFSSIIDNFIFSLKFFFQPDGILARKHCGIGKGNTTAKSKLIPLNSSFEILEEGGCLNDDNFWVCLTASEPEKDEVEEEVEEEQISLRVWTRMLLISSLPLERLHVLNSWMLGQFHQALEPGKAWNCRQAHVQIKQKIAIGLRYRCIYWEDRDGSSCSRRSGCWLFRNHSDGWMLQ